MAAPADVERYHKHIEGALRLALPFDASVLEYLLRLAQHSDRHELLELVGDFCPRWASKDRASLVTMLLQYAEESGGSASPPGRNKVSSGSSGVSAAKADQAAAALAGALADDDDDDDAYGAAASPAAASDPRAERAMAADMMLAQLLQEEEDAEAGLGGGRNSRAGVKKGKNKFKPMNINYTVGHNAAAAAIGTAQPSSLADLLRSRRQQQQASQRPGIGLHPEAFGPSVASRPPSTWAPSAQEGQQGLTWAERAQVAQEQAEAAEQQAALAVAAAPLAPVEQFAPSSQARTVAASVPGGMQLKLMTGNNAEYMVTAGPSETIGDIKARVEKLHSIPMARQRLLHLGRELQDHLEVRAVGLRPGTALQLALRNVPPGGAIQRTAPPPPAGGPPPSAVSRAQHPPATRAAATTMLLKLKLPGGVTAQVEDMAETASVLDLKRRIQQEQGIRAEHILMTFFGCPLPDASKLADCGIASGAVLNIALRPPGAATSDPFQGDPFADEEEAAPARPSASAVGSRAQGQEAGAGKKKKGKKNKGGDEGGAAAAASAMSALEAHSRRSQPAEPPTGRLAAASKRADLVRKVFSACDLDGDGTLREQEMHIFAKAMGFEDPPEKWAEEYEDLCREHGMDPTEGIDEEVLAKMVDDESDKGCYCTNEELRSVLDQVEAEAKKIKALLAASPPPPTTASVSVPEVCRTEAQDPRSKSLRRLFELLDADGDGHLRVHEMETFAQLTGFEGEADEWASEFSALCSESGVDAAAGLDRPTFVHFVNDESDAGQYCTDEEVAEMIARLEARRAEAVEPALVAAPAVETAAEITSALADASAGQTTDRPQLIASLFRRLDVDADGFLSLTEMRKFADLSGFEGSDADWRDEYAAIVTEHGLGPRGVPPSCFAQMVDDDSDDGCFLSDDEIREMIKDLPQVDARAAASAAGPARAADLPEPPAAAPPAPPASLKPPGLPTPPLGPAEAPAVAPTFAPPARPQHDAAPAAAAATDASAPDAQAVLSAVEAAIGPPAVPRPQLVAALFHALDADGDGHLCKAEMRRFAMLSGFDGGDDDWDEEFASIVAEKGLGPKGVPERTLALMLDDDSDDGVYNSDEEIRDLLREILPDVRARAAAQAPRAATAAPRPKAAPPPPRSSVATKPPGLGTPPMGPSGAAPPGAAPPPALAAPPRRAQDPQTREELIEAAFFACDRDGDDRLSSAEMRVFAERIGFEGDDASWDEEFASLLRESGADTRSGVSLELFVTLVNDMSDNGCYCTDDELKALLGMLEASRRSCISRLFATLDSRRSQELSVSDLQTFVDALGDPHGRRADELFMACRDMDDAAGVTEGAFAKLVDGQVFGDFFCTQGVLEAAGYRLPSGPSGMGREQQ